MSHSAWTPFDYNSRHSIPKEPGVYALYSDDGLEYIGSSACLRQRAPRHFIRQKFVAVRGSLRGKYKVMRKYGSWLMAEARLIRRLRPRRNGPPGNAGGRR